jgi:hypothetical protein
MHGFPPFGSGSQIWALCLNAADKSEWFHNTSNTRSIPHAFTDAIIDQISDWEASRHVFHSYVLILRLPVMIEEGMVMNLKDEDSQEKLTDECLLEAAISRREFLLVIEYFSTKGQEATEKYFWKNVKAAYKWIGHSSSLM